MKNTKSKKNFPLILTFLWTLLCFPGKNYTKVKVEDLPPVYKKWLTEEVVYIITQKEKEVFLQLETSRERDLFIEAFWKQRDPNPSTAENEFRDEHYQRIDYANQKFERTSTKPGWKTDRGKIHIILGKPVSIETYGTLDSNVVPIEVWFYQGKYGSGLPSSFYVVFFQEEGIGDYILYSPVRHGPRKLLESYDGDPKNAINVLSRISQELANVSCSLIPGESSINDPKTSVSSEILLNKIAALPQNMVRDQYAEKLLKYKSIVEVDHSVNYVDNDAIVKIVKDKGDFFFVHYAVEPKRLSIGKKEDKYFINLEIFGKISDSEGRMIYQFQKKVSLDLPPEQMAEIKSKLFSFQDLFPLIPGNFKFDLLIKNSVSKEFTSLEKDITVPQSTFTPAISALIFSPRVERNSPQKTLSRPFQFGNLQIYPPANRAFTPKDKLFVCFKIYGLTQDLKESGTIEFSLFKENERVHDLRKNISEYQDPETFLEEISLAEFPPGRYTGKVSIFDKNRNEILAESEDFLISSVSFLPRAWSLSEILPPSDDPLYLHILGTQLLNKGETEKAIAFLEEAYLKKPVSFAFALALADAYFDLKKYEKVQDILSRFLEKAKEESKIYYMLGKSNYLLGEYGKAIYFFKKYLSYFGSHLEILNSLGECYLQTGNKEEALTAWEKSLEINPKQEELKDKVAALKKKE